MTLLKCLEHANESLMQAYAEARVGDDDRMSTSIAIHIADVSVLIERYKLIKRTAGENHE